MPSAAEAGGAGRYKEGKKPRGKTGGARRSGGVISTLQTENLETDRTTSRLKGGKRAKYIGRINFYREQYRCETCQARR